MRWGPTHWVYILAHAIVFLLGALAVSLGGTIWVSIGTSLIAAGAAGWVLFLYVLFSKDAAESLELLTEYGLKNAFDKRGPNIRPVYETRLRKANSSIDIMGFGLRTFRQDFDNYFEQWAYSLKMRVLLIDPEFPSEDQTYANQRDHEEGNNMGKIHADVRDFVESTSYLLQDNNTNFEVKLYTCLPSMTIFKIDDEIFWGPYTVKDQSRNMPIFLVDSHGQLFSFLQDHFDTIWNDPHLSRPVPEEWLD